MLDGVRVGILVRRTAIPVFTHAEHSPHKQIPFHANRACPGNSLPPTREKPILFQCPADDTSHQKASHCFHAIIYCFVPCALEEMVLPNIFHILSQRSLCKCLLSLLGSVCVILDIITVAMSSNYVFNCLEGLLITSLIQPWASTLDLLLFGVNKSKRSGDFTVSHGTFCTTLNIQAIWEARTNILQVLLEMGRNFQPKFPSRWFTLKQQ